MGKRLDSRWQSVIIEHITLRKDKHMGLDQYAYSVEQGGKNDGEEHHLAEWRKHNRLQGWMEQLWEDKGRPFDGKLDENPMGDFNCIPLELTLSDISELEESITEMALPETGGFFFGSDSFEWEDEDGNPPAEGDYYYKQNDLQFIEDARKALREGKKVFYNCWW